MKKVIFLVLSIVLTSLFFMKGSPALGATSCSTTDNRSGFCSGTSGCDLTQNELIALSQTNPGQVHPSNCWGLQSGCCVPKSTPGALEAQFTDLCSFAQGEGKSQCDKCVTSDPPGIWTAIGCIPATIDGFVKKVLPFAMGLGGGIAFLLMLFGALQIMTSAGNPEKLNAGKELVTSAIVGLLLIIFSIFLLRLIGTDILGVPGFGGTP